MVKVSAIISTYNSEKFISGKIEDLLNQTIAGELEIIVVNSGSKQNEKNIIQEFQKKTNNIKYLETIERETIYKAWNRAIEIAEGKYITNANADDRLRNDCYEILANELDKNNDVAIVYGDQFITDIPNQKFNEFKKNIKFSRTEYSKLKLLSNYEVGSQSMWRCSIHKKDKIYFNEKYEVAGDYDFCCNVAEKYKLKKINKILGLCYRSRENENKELQNKTITEVETIEIREKYLTRYLKSLSVTEKKELLQQVEKYLLFPKYLHYLIFRVNRKLNLKNEVLPRAFVCWLGSLLAEMDGNYNLAKSFCFKGLSKSSEIFIGKQLEKLKSI